MYDKTHKKEKINKVNNVKEKKIKLIMKKKVSGNFLQQPQEAIRGVKMHFPHNILSS